MAIMYVIHTFPLLQQLPNLCSMFTEPIWFIWQYRMNHLTSVSYHDNNSAYWIVVSRTIHIFVLTNFILNFQLHTDLMHTDMQSTSLDLSYDGSQSPGSGSSMSQQTRNKRMRTSFKHHQLRTMKSYFAINQNPDAKDLKQLSQKTGLSKRVLQVIYPNNTFLNYDFQ